MLVRHAPRTTTILSHEGVIIVIHAVGARTIVAFPARRIVITVAGIVGHTVLTVVVSGSIAVNGSGGAAVVTVVGIAATIIVVVTIVVTIAIAAVTIIIISTTEIRTNAGAGDYAGGVGHGCSCGGYDSAAAGDIGRWCGAGCGCSHRRARVQREKVLL